MFWGLTEVQRNPIELVRVKGGTKRAKRLITFTTGDCERFDQHLREPVRTMVKVAICTGLRISEILALRWECLDFEARTMQVERGVVNGRIGRTKTETSREEFPLFEDLAPILQSWRAQQGENSGLVFFLSNYRRVLPRWYSPTESPETRRRKDRKARVRMACVSASIPHAAGLNRSVGGRPEGFDATHANISTTMNTYGKAHIKAKQEANRKVVQMILPKAAICA